MTNNERITAHNARLAAMKETVAGLPDAGSGGSGSVKTYSVNIVGYDILSSGPIHVFYYKNNLKQQVSVFASDLPYDISDVECEKPMVIFTDKFSEPSGAFMLKVDGNPIDLQYDNEYCILYGNGHAAILTIPTSVNHIDITIYRD